MTLITTALGLAATVLLSVGYTVRVAFEHDRLVDDERYPAGAAAGAGPGVPARPTAAAVVRLVPAARSRAGVGVAAPRLSAVV